MVQTSKREVTMTARKQEVNEHALGGMALYSLLVTKRRVGLQ
jgi:hypothetical protein